MKRSWAILSVAVLGSSLAFGGSAILRLNATGTITPLPTWQDDKWAVITDLTLDFGGQVASADPAINRDSTAAKARLVNPLTDPARVDVVRPKKCTIGTTTVVDDHVYLLMDNTEITIDKSVTLKASQLYNWALRFAAIGKYGSASGKVGCLTAGTMTYTY